MKRLLTPIIFLVALLAPLFLFRNLQAAGQLDTSFGTGGTGTSVTSIRAGNDQINALVRQPDGKIIAGGLSHNGGNNDFVIARFNSDGTLDTTFASVGWVVRDFGVGNDMVNALALQPDGKILAAGRAAVTGGTSDFGIARYNADGTLDTTFGTGGTVTTDIGGESNTASALVLQSDGKIVVGGVADMAAGAATNNDLALVRYNSDGTLDNTFDTDGIVTTDVRIGFSSSLSNSINSLALQSDGKIIAVGRTTIPGGATNNDFVVARYNTNGSLDVGADGDPAVSFGTTGYVTTSIGTGNDWAAAAVIQPDGKIVAGGYTSSGTRILFALTRYNSNGTLDTSFDSDGIVTTNISNADDRINALALQSDGKILAAGRSQNGYIQDFSVARYNSNGSLDTTFNTSGWITTHFGGPANNAATAAAAHINGMILEPDEEIIVGGYSGRPTTEFTLAKYRGDRADLSLSLDLDTDPVVVMTNVNYRMTVTNNGPESARTVSLSGINPVNESGCTVPADCAGSPANSCNLGSLAVSSSRTIEISCTPATAAGWVVFPSVSGLLVDPVMTNNSESRNKNIVAAGCGNLVWEATEACDDGNATNCDGCQGDCSAVETGCGDGFVCGAEQCDDGNTTAGDRCSATCQTEGGGSGGGGGGGSGSGAEGGGGSGAGGAAAAAGAATPDAAADPSSPDSNDGTLGGGGGGCTRIFSESPKQPDSAGAVGGGCSLIPSKSCLVNREIQALSK